MLAAACAQTTGEAAADASNALSVSHVASVEVGYIARGPPNMRSRRVHNGLKEAFRSQRFATAFGKALAGERELDCRSAALNKMLPSQASCIGHGMSTSLGRRSFVHSWRSCCRKQSRSVKALSAFQLCCQKRNSVHISTTECNGGKLSRGVNLSSGEFPLHVGLMGKGHM